MSLPDLEPLALPVPEELLVELEPIVLDDMDYQLARAVPGAEYSREHKAMVLRRPTARAAIVALSLKPMLANTHPELVELRDSVEQRVRLTDHATGLGIAIDAPHVYAAMQERGYDWLDFDHEVNEPVPIDGGPNARQRHSTRWPNQATDLGYAAAMIEKLGWFLLGWTRGGGKTLGTAAIIDANHYKSVLVAAPNSAKFDTWLRELEWALPTHQVLVLGNTPLKRNSALEAAKRLDAAGTPFVLVVHHESLALVAGKSERKSGRGVTIQGGWSKLGIRWDLFAFDEAHRLKNAGNNGSQLHRAACRVPAEHRLALTGSLYENSWEEPYGMLHWMAPKRYRAQWNDWNLRFLDYVEGYGKVCVGILPGREDAMGQELGVFTIIRNKRDRTQHHDVMVELSPGQRKAYDELVNQLLTQLDDGKLIYAEAGIVQLTRLRQIASGLELLSDKVTDSTKLDQMEAIVGGYEEFDDFFVATWYKAMAYAAQERLNAAGYDAMVITGDTPQAQRTATLARARKLAEARAKDPSLPPVILIGTIATLGESVNLQFLNHVIRLDRTYNPAWNRQTIDRLDRTGQLRTVRVSDIIAIDTVDQLLVLPSLANKDAMRAILLGRAA